MERNANYALVGLISLVLTIALVLFVMWLARLQFANEYQLYDADFTGPVRGLSAGGEVYFNGIRVGEVTRLSLDAQNPNRVVARLRISADAPVRVDSHATLEPLGVTGVNYIQITAGTLTQPLLVDVTPDGRIPVLATRQGALASLLEGGGTVLARTVDALDRVNRMLSDQNLQTFGAVLSDARTVTAELRDHREMIAALDSTIRSADVAAQRVAELSESANRLVTGDAQRTLETLAEAADELKIAAQEGRTMIANLQGPTTDFATTALPQVTGALVQLQTTTETLNRVIGEIESNPSRLISKPPARTIEVQP